VSPVQELASDRSLTSFKWKEDFTFQVRQSAVLARRATEAEEGSSVRCGVGGFF